MPSPGQTTQRLRLQQPGERWVPFPSLCDTRIGATRALVTVTGWATRQARGCWWEAQRWLDEIASSVLTGDYVDPVHGQISFAEFYAEWSARQVWADGTRIAADAAAGAVPFAAVPLAALRRSHVEHWVKAMSVRLAPTLWRGVRVARAIDDFTLHDLGHFYASGLIAAGCDVVTVQRSLGHSAPSITLDTYAHLWSTA